jgi:iron complex outermembrane receptor protein
MEKQASALQAKCRFSVAQLFGGGALGLMSAFSLAAELEPKDVLGMSPEDLGKLQVTSVSKRPELLSEAAAAVYVITAEDIRRSPATTLNEVLRLAPTLYTPFDNGVPGYVSARGQTNGIYSGGNKLLVLIDGRSVYSPFFSGVMWDAQSIVLADIERIEVISGPAGVLWGVNAVNGVINVITKNAAQTQGVLASVGAGDRARDGVFRYGGTAGESGHYRLYGQSERRGSSIKEIDGSRVDDDWRKNSVGGRLDWKAGANTISTQFNAMSANQGQPLPIVVTPMTPPPPFPRVAIDSFNMLGRWTHVDRGGGNLAVQIYFDHVAREMQPTVNDKGDVLDLEVQRTEAARGMHRLTWGGNLRYYRDATENSSYIGWFPDRVIQRWVSLFLQDDITLNPLWRLTTGVRVERGPYNTTDVLPTLRLARRIGDTQTLWGGLSRAARSPTRLDAEFRIPAVAPFNFMGNPNIRSETVKVAEIGYRYQGQTTTASVSLYRNFYDGLSGVITTTGVGPPFMAVNGGRGQATGIEAWGEWRVTSGWRLSGGFTAASEWYYDRTGVTTIGMGALSASTPANTAQLRSSWNLPYKTELDVIYRHVSTLGLYAVPSYETIDFRLGWKLSKSLNLDIIGQNMLGTQHAEYGAITDRALMSKRIYTRLTWRQ